MPPRPPANGKRCATTGAEPPRLERPLANGKRGATTGAGPGAEHRGRYRVPAPAPLRVLRSRARGSARGAGKEPRGDGTRSTARSPPAPGRGSLRAEPALEPCAPPPSPAARTPGQRGKQRNTPTRGPNRRSSTGRTPPAAEKYIDRSYRRWRGGIKENHSSTSTRNSGCVTVARPGPAPRLLHGCSSVALRWGGSSGQPPACAPRGGMSSKARGRGSRGGSRGTGSPVPAGRGRARLCPKKEANGPRSTKSCRRLPLEALAGGGASVLSTEVGLYPAGGERAKPPVIPKRSPPLLQELCAQNPPRPCGKGLRLPHMVLGLF